MIRELQECVQLFDVFLPLTLFTFSLITNSFNVKLRTPCLPFCSSAFYLHLVGRWKMKTENVSSISVPSEENPINEGPEGSNRNR